MDIFTGNCTYFQMEENRRITFFVAIVISCFIIFLNILLLQLYPFVQKLEKNKVPFHIFYVSLAISDLMNGIFLCMYALTLLENNANRWQNFELCSFIVFSTNTVCTVTGYTLMLISVVQFFSVAYPLRCRNIVTRRCAVFISVLTWLCCIVLLTVIPLFFLNEKKRIVDEECTLEIIFRGNMEKVRKLNILVASIFVGGIAISNAGCLLLISKRHGRVQQKKRSHKNNIENETYLKDTKPQSGLHSPSTVTEQTNTGSDNQAGQLSSTYSTLYQGDVKSTENVLSMFSIQEKYIHENEGEQIQNDTPINKSNLEIEINLPTGSPKGTSCSESKRRPLNGEKSMAMHNDKGKEQLKKAFYMVFMRVILYFICLAPSSLVVCFSTNAFTSETCRTVRFGMYLFLQMTSFINPILTLSTIPVFREAFLKRYKVIFNFCTNK